MIIMIIMIKFFNKIIQIKFKIIIKTKINN